MLYWRKESSSREIEEKMMVIENVIVDMTREEERRRGGGGGEEEAAISKLYSSDIRGIGWIPIENNNYENVSRSNIVCIDLILTRNTSNISDISSSCQFKRILLFFIDYSVIALSFDAYLAPHSKMLHADSLMI